ncbi:MAG: hypothetical protein CMJ19_03775 [Phycisphaeraceae bacterium]|nr:hypothetical protein [Phycisphaeraceae bacterium]
MGTIFVKHSGKTGCEIFHLGPLGLVLPLGHCVRPCGVWVAAVAMDSTLATRRRVWPNRYQKQQRKFEHRHTSKHRELFDAQDAINQQREELIAKIEKQLKQSNSIQSLYTIRWAIQ